MFKYALAFLVVSLVAGVLGLTNLAVTARRVSLVLFVLFFLLFLGALGLVWIFDETVMPRPPTTASLHPPSRPPPLVTSP
jgi:uncharacterized membrane protein YtjA (UPF0391 family)